MPIVMISKSMLRRSNVADGRILWDDVFLQKFVFQTHQSATCRRYQLLLAHRI